MFYSKTAGGFYDREIHGDNIPADAVEITDELHAALIEDQSRGKHIVANEHGFPVAIAPPPAPVTALLEQAKSELRPLRNSILSEVVQIGLAAKALGNDALANEVLEPESGVRRRLLDITDDTTLNSAQTIEEMRAAVLAAYRRIADSVSADLRLAFKQLEA